MADVAGEPACGPVVAGLYGPGNDHVNLLMAGDSGDWLMLLRQYVSHGPEACSLQSPHFCWAAGIWTSPTTERSDRESKLENDTELFQIRNNEIRIRNQQNIQTPNEYQDTRNTSGYLFLSIEITKMIF